MNYQEKCKHEFVGYNICCYCGFCKNYNGEIVSPYIAANVQQVCDDFEKWYFAIKEEHGQPPLAMQIFYWFETHPIPSTTRPASPSPGWIKASERLPEGSGSYNAEYAHMAAILDILDGQIVSLSLGHKNIPVDEIFTDYLKWLSESPAKPEGEGLRIALEFVRNLYELKYQTPEVSHLIGEFEKFVYNQGAAHSPAGEGNK